MKTAFSQRKLLRLNNVNSFFEYICFVFLFFYVHLNMRFFITCIFVFLVLSLNAQRWDVYSPRFFNIHHPKQFYIDNSPINVIDSTGLFQGIHYFISQWQFNDSAFKIIPDSSLFLYCNFRNGIADSIWTVVNKDRSYSTGKLTTKDKKNIHDSLFSYKYLENDEIFFPLSKYGIWTIFDNESKFICTERYEYGKNRKKYYTTHFFIDSLGKEQVTHYNWVTKQMFSNMYQKHCYMEYYPNGSLKMHRLISIRKTFHKLYYPNGQIHVHTRGKLCIFCKFRKVKKIVYNENGEKICTAIGFRRRDGTYIFSQGKNCYY